MLQSSTFTTLTQPGWGDRLDEENVLDDASYAELTLNEISSMLVAGATKQSPVVYSDCCRGVAAPAMWTAPPQISGIPGFVFEMLPPSARRIISTPSIAVRLCAFCSSLSNITLSPEGLIERVFCESCITVISLTPSYACLCGNKRYVDPVGLPSILCTQCHKAKPRRSKMRRLRVGVECN